MYYSLTLQPDGLICMLEAERFDEDIVNLFFKLTEYSREKEFVFNGDLVNLPIYLNDISLISLEDVPEIFKFMEEDFLKADIYEELTNRIEKMKGSKICNEEKAETKYYYDKTI